MKAAKSIIGIDINKPKNNCTFLLKDAEKPFDLKEKFEVIVAAEVLDHVCDLGIFMDNIKKHLAPDGIVIITIHNPQAFEFFLELFIKGKVFDDVHTHTHWQSIRTLDCLLRKHGLRIISRQYIHFKAASKIGKIYDKLAIILPQRFSRSTLYVATHI